VIPLAPAEQAAAFSGKSPERQTKHTGFAKTGQPCLPKFFFHNSPHVLK